MSLLDFLFAVMNNDKIMQLFPVGFCRLLWYNIKYTFHYIIHGNVFQSAKSVFLKCQNDTLKCALEEIAVLGLGKKNSTMKHQEVVEATGKSIATIKRIMKSLQDKNYIRRESGKRYGK